MIKNKQSQRSIAKEWGISKSAVRRINLNAEVLLEMGDINETQKRIVAPRSNQDLNSLIFDAIAKLRDKSLTVAKAMIKEIWENTTRKRNRRRF